LENVKALVSDKFYPTFKLWFDWLAEQGYSNFYKVLNAKDYGVPQNRERVFLVSILNEEDSYCFPEERPLDKCLGDVLEENVEDSYYLSEKSIAGFLQHNDNHTKKGTGFK